MAYSSEREAGVGVGERLRGRWRRPRSLTSIVPMGDVDPTELRRRIARLVPVLECALSGLPGLHSFRLVVVPPNERTNRDPRLLLNAVHNQPLHHFATRLATVAGDVLLEAFAGAPGMPAEAAQLPELLVRHRSREQTLHLGSTNKSVE